MGFYDTSFNKVFDHHMHLFFLKVELELHFSTELRKPKTQTYKGECTHSITTLML